MKFTFRFYGKSRWGDLNIKKYDLRDTNFLFEYEADLDTLKAHQQRTDPWFVGAEVLAVRIVSIFTIWKGKQLSQYQKGKVGGII